MNRSIFTALTLALAAMIFAAATPSHAEDACAGQEWPNYSSDCIEQMVNTIADTMREKEPPAQRANPIGQFKAQ